MGFKKIDLPIARFGRQAKRSYGFIVKLASVAILGLCFVFVWYMFSPSASSVSYQRSTFGEIAEPVSQRGQLRKSKSPVFVSIKHEPDLRSGKVDDKKRVNGSLGLDPVDRDKDSKKKEKGVKEDKQVIENQSEVAESEVENGKENEVEKESEEGKEEGENVVDSDLVGAEGDVDQVNESDEMNVTGGKKQKFKGPLFDPKAQYSWKMCSTRSKHNYIPCIDIEVASKRIQGYRHHERSCPKNPLMCLIPLPHEGYETPVSWPQSREKVCLYNIY